MDSTSIVLKLGNREITLEDAIVQGIAQVLNGKIVVLTNEPVQLSLPTGMSLTKENVVLLDNGEDVEVTINDGNGESIVLILKGMGELLATYDAEQGGAAPFQAFQAGESIVVATLEDAAPAAAAGPAQQDPAGQQQNSPAPTQQSTPQEPVNNPTPQQNTAPETPQEPETQNNEPEDNTPEPQQFVLNATFTGTRTGVLTEDSDNNVTTTTGRVVATTNLGETLTFTAKTVEGVFGTFTLSTNGTWTYTLNNSKPLTQALNKNEVAPDTFTVETTDGNFSSTVTISIQGRNDTAIISADDATINENVVFVSGTATSIDVDDEQENVFQVVNNIQTTYGSYSVSSNGTWTYTLDNENSAVDSLKPTSSVLTDTITITSIDGTTEEVTITINGTNDSPVLDAISSINVNEDASIVEGTITASDKDDANLTYSTTATVAGFTLNANGTYSFDPSNLAYNSMTEGQQQTITIPVTVADENGGTDSKNLVINLTGSNDAPIADVSLVSVSESTLSNPTLGEIQAYSVTTDGDIEYSTTISTTLVDIPNFTEQIKAALTVVFPSVSVNDISVVTTLLNSATNSYKVDVTISNFTSTPYANIAPSMMSTLLGLTVPGENSLYTGSLNITDVDSNSFTTTLNPLTTSVTITTASPLFTAIIDSISSSPTAIISSLQNIFLGTTNAPTIEIKTLSGETLALLMKAGLMYIDLDSAGNYTIYSPLFNVLGSAESLAVNLGYAVSDGTDTTTAVKVIRIDGSNDAPTAYEQTISTELAIGETSYSGALPGAYYQTIINSVLLNIQGSGAAQIVDVDALQTSIMDSLMPSDFNISLDSIQAFSLYAVMDSFETSLDSAIAAILAVAEGNSGYTPVGNAESIIQSFLFDYIQNANTNTQKYNAVTALGTNLGITFTSTELTQMYALGGDFKTTVFELSNTLLTELLAIIGIQDTNGDISTTEVLVSLIGFAQGTAKLNETVDGIMTLIVETLGVDSGTTDQFGFPIYEFPTQEQNDNADYLLSLVANSDSLMSLTSLDPASIIDFNGILSSLGIDLTTIDFNTILEDVQADLTTFLETMDLTTINSDPNFIEAKLIELLDEVFVLLDETIDTILNNTTTQQLQDAILTGVIDGVMTELGYDNVADALDAQYIELRDLISVTLEELTAELMAGITIEAIKEAALTNILEQIGLDTGFLNKVSRDVIASDMAEDILVKLSMDEDTIDTFAMEYEIVDGSVVTTVFDRDGNDVTPSNLAATTVTVNADGTYTVENPDFASLNTLYNLVIEFDYVANDGEALSAPQGVTLNIELADATVSDGHISGAIVFEDLNGNKTYDEGEKFTYTDEEGNFYLDATGPLVSYGGTDISTGLPYEGILTAPAGSSVLSPLTTLIQTLVDKGMSLEDAKSSVSSTFGLDSSLDLLNYDSYGIATDANSSDEEKATAVKVQSAAVQLVTVMSQVASAADSSNQDEEALNVVDSIATMIQNGDSVDLTSTSTLGTILSASGVTTDATNIATAIANLNQAVSQSTTAEEIAAVQVVSEEIERDIEDDGTITTVKTTEEIKTQSTTVVVNKVPTVEIIATTSTDEETDKVITFTASDIDGTIVSTTATASKGTVLVDSVNGELTYTPNANFNGTDTIVLVVTDEDGAFTTKAVTITVNSVNDLPTLEVVSTASVDEDGTKTISFIASDIEGAVSTTATIDDEAKGTVSINEENGEITFTPATNFNGIATITVTTTDSDKATAQKTIEVTVNSVNDLPTLEVVSQVSMSENSSKTISFTASDIEGAVSTTATIDDEDKGTVSINEENGEITFTPSTDFVGTAIITLVTTDSENISTSKTVTVNVSNANDKPVITVTDSIILDEDTYSEEIISIIDNDGTVQNVTITTATEATAVIVDGKLVYTPAPDYFGSDTITITATDDRGESSVKTILVTVTDVNEVPVVTVVDTKEATEDTPFTIDFNALDTDGTIVSIDASASNGVVTFNNDFTQLTYTPTSNFNGEDTITITVEDSAGDITTKYVTVNVTSVNDIPVVEVVTDVATEVDGLVSVYNGTLTATDVEDTAFTFAVTDADVNNAKVTNLSIELDSNTGAYNVVGNFDALAAGEEAVVTFNYTATDSENGTSEAKTVTITVTGTNDAPVAIEATENIQVPNQTSIDGYLPGSTFAQYLNPNSINPVEFVSDYEVRLVNQVSFNGNTTYTTSDMMNLTMNSLGVTADQALLGLDSLIDPLMTAADNVKQLYTDLPETIKESVIANIGALDSETALDSAIASLISSIKQALASSTPETVMATASETFANSLFTIYDSNVNPTNLATIQRSITTLMAEVETQADNLISDIVAAIKAELQDTGTSHDIALATEVASLITALEGNPSQTEAIITSFGNSISNIYGSPVNLADLIAVESVFNTKSAVLEGLTSSLVSDIVSAIEVQLGNNTKTSSVTTAVTTLIAGLEAGNSEALDTFGASLFTIYESSVTPTKLAGLETIFTTQIGAVSALRYSLVDDIKTAISDALNNTNYNDIALTNAINTFLGNQDSTSFAQNVIVAYGGDQNVALQVSQGVITQPVATVISNLETAANSLSQNIADEIESLIGVTLTDDSSLVSSIDSLLASINATPAETTNLVTAFGLTLFDVFDASVTPADLTAIQGSISTLQTAIETAYTDLITSVVTTLENQTGVTNKTVELTALVNNIADGTTAFESFPSEVFSILGATVSIANLENIGTNVQTIVADLQTAANNLPTAVTQAILTTIGTTDSEGTDISATLGADVLTLMTALQADDANVDLLLANFVNSLFTTYKAEVTPTMLETIATDIQTAADTLETAILTLPETMIDTLITTLGVTDATNSDISYLEGIALATFASLATATSAEVLEGVSAIISETISRFGLSVEQVILDNLSAGFVASVETLNLAISNFSKEALFTNVDLTSTLGIDLSVIDTSTITTNLSNGLETYLQGLTIEDFLLNSAYIQETIKGSLETLVSSIEGVVDTTITLTQEELNTAILNMITAAFNEQLTSYRTELEAMFGTLTNEEFASFTNTLISSIIGTNVISIEAVKGLLVVETLDSLGFDSEIAGELAREEVAGDILESVINRVNSDVDTDNPFTLTYSIDEEVAVITTVNGVEMEGTTVSVAANGSYTITNAGFESLDPSSDISVIFNYKISDVHGTGTSEAYTVNIDLTDTATFTSNDAETLDLATLLSNVSDLDVVDIKSGDHILSNLTVDEFIALTDEDNTLRIMGDSEDSINLDSNWTQMMQTDGVSPYLDAQGYTIYTAQNSANETIKLLIQEDITVNI